MTDDSGHFNLRCPLGFGKPEDEVRIRADGFTAISLRVPAHDDGVADLGVVALDASEIKRVQVTRGGVPAAGAEVFVVCANRGRTPVDETLVGLTGEDGLLSVETWADALVYAHHAGASSRLTALSSGVETIPLELSEVPCVVTLRRAQLEDESEYVLRFQRSARDLGVLLERRVSHGKPEGVKLPSGTYQVSAASTGQSVLGCVPGKRVPTSKAWQFTLAETASATGAERVEILVDSVSVPTLIATNAESDAPIRRLLIQLEADFGDGWFVCNQYDPFVENEDGRYALSFLQGFDFDSVRGTRMTIEAPGFETLVLEEPAVREPKGTLRVCLVPTDSRVSVRVLDFDERPFPHRVYIQNAETGRVVLGEKPDANGILRDVGSPDKVLKLLIPKSGKNYMRQLVSSGDGNTSIDVEANGVIRVVVPTGSIVASGGHPASIFVCRGPDQEVYQGYRQGERWVWNSLPEGTYNISRQEEASVDAMLAYRGLLGEGTYVSRGEETFVDLVEATEQMSTLSGTLVPVGIEADLLYVSPVYGGKSAPIPTDSIRPRFPVDASGGFTLTGLRAAPQRLLVATLDEFGAEIPLLAFAPGNRPIVEVSWVELLVKTTPVDPEFQAIIPIRFPGGESLAWMFRHGMRGEKLLLGPFPVGTTNLQITGNSMREVIPIDLVGGPMKLIEREY